MISCNNSKNPSREPAYAGSFYPAEPKELKKIILKYLKETEKQELEGRLYGIISPHAGYVYSGQVAAHAYKLLEDKKIDTVILLGLSHRYPLKHPSLYKSGYYKTPLGKVEIDEDIVKKIQKHYPSITYIPDAHKYEHSLEVQIPFLQVVLKNKFKIVPILIGQISAGVITELPKVLYNICNDKEKVILITSTDFSHYPEYSDAVKVDKETIELIKNFKTMELVEREQKIKESEIKNLATYQCGLGPIVVILNTLYKFKNTKVHLIDYKNSGDTSSRKEKVVGYAAMAITADNNNEKSFNLNDDEKKNLLKMARETLESYVQDQKIPEFKIDNPKFKQNAGAFVTLNKNKQLRGCIGYIAPVKPLYQTIIENAVNSCSKDYRFPPVSKAELKDIKIEISVLTPPVGVDSYKNIQIGKHGIILKKGFHQAVFLPQVAPEQGWDINTTLSHLSVKAGLGSDEWKEGADFEVFEAIVFHEK